ncbi:sugar transferase [Methylobacterium nigriterrae]|uniref:sugar transferase n=1 Tax=Methylobacterium nigriterrae TaxID=3127512 RepID=UPI003D66F95E
MGRRTSAHTVSLCAGPSFDAQRLLDMCVASLALAAFAPLMLLIAIAILIESGRPILFAQTRLGRHGRHFRMYKFRKLNNSCGTAGCPLTLEGDERLTVVGAVLRSSKLDELPQFWNVLMGDMSVVGPRPETLAFADCFEGEFKGVLEYRPGILGPSQVAFRNESALIPCDADVIGFYRTVLFPAKARLDLEYYGSRTVLTDLGWILRGALAVLELHPALPSGAFAAPTRSDEDLARSIGATQGAGSTSVETLLDGVTQRSFVPPR